MRCKLQTRSGAPCKAAVVRGTDRCVLHSSRAHEIAAKGGRSRHVRSHDLMELPAPKSARLLLDVLAASVVEVRTLRMDARTGATIAALGNALHRVIETTAIEDRLRAIEQRQDEQDRRGNEFRRQGY
jgi:hypothetical protein